jgi:cell division protein FtsN
MNWHRHSLLRHTLSNPSAILATKPSMQRGGTTMGVIVGLLVGLALALAVALYVTKVPVPFVNKVPQRNAEQDAADIERNRKWDPNAKLGGSAPAKPASTTQAPAAAGPAAPGATAGVVPPYVPPVPPLPGVAGAAGATASPRAAPAPATNATTAAVPPAPTRPADEVKSTRTGPDPFVYFVQAGAYSRQEDAEQQRARLAMLGFTAKVTEREQVGRTMYRVRLGPFDGKDQANATQQRLQQGGVDAALVAVEKSR